MSVVRVGVLGPIGAWTPDGARLALPGPRHREVLARLLVARGRVVPLAVLIDDLWDDEPPAGAASAVRTFVAALRRALEPGRAPRTPARLVITEGTGYRVRADVDAWDFEERVRTAPDLPGMRRIEQLEAALRLWRGPAFDEVADRSWATGEAAKLTELRLNAVELLAQARLRHGRPEEAIADLQVHLHEHPNREQAWLLNAQALHGAGRGEDALAVLRRARTRLVEEFGLDPSDRIARLEHDILAGGEPEHDLWRSTATAFAGASPRSLLTASADLLHGLAITNASGLSAAQSGRAAAVDQLRSLDDPELTARILVRLEVPGLWSCLDDPARSAELVSMARRCLDQASPALRARLLALIGVESRGTRGTAGLDAALEAEALARELGDPAILVQALNARFLQSFHTIGAWPERAKIADELIAVSRRHDISTYEILGHLIGLQAAAAVNDVATADRHAEAADRLGTRHERELVVVFTTWWQALRRTLTNQDSHDAYERALATLPGCGMPGVIRGLAPLTRFCVGLPNDGADFGPNTPYVRPLLTNDPELLRAAPAPPPDHLAELRWALLGEAALRLGDRDTARAVHAALAPAAGELIGAGTGMLSLRPVSDLLARLA